MAGVYWKPLFFTLLLSVLAGGLDLKAQKQAPARKARPRIPVVPVPVSSPKVRVPERAPIATSPQPPLATLQSSVTEARLQNGVRVLLQENHSRPLVSLGCWYRVGAKDDPAGAAGLSNLARLARWRDLGSYSREQTGRLMLETGGEWNSVTLPDQTGFFETVPANALEDVLKLEAARMSTPRVDPTDFTGYRRRAVAMVSTRADDSKSLLDDEVAAVALQRHPYRWPAQGWLPDVENIRFGDVSQHLRQHFVSANAVVVLVGDFETRSALALVEKHFGSIAYGANTRRIEVREPKRRGERRVRTTGGNATPYLQFAFHAPELLNDDFYAMLLLDAVLTGAQGMPHWTQSQPAIAKTSSRLFRALVEPGLALEVCSSIAPRQAPGLYRLTLALPDAFQLQPAEEAVLEQLERLKNQEVSDVELARARNLLVAGEFLAQNSLSKRAFQLGYFESIASYRLLNEIEPKISRVDKDDLRRVAIRYFSENARTVGSLVPVARQRAVEVEILSPSGSDVQTAGPAPAVPAPAAEELEARVPFPLAALLPDSVFAPKASESASLQKRVSETEDLPEVPTARPSAPQVQRKVLANGVTLIAAHNHAGSTVSIQAAFRPAVEADAAFQPGVAGLVSELLWRRVSGKRQVPLAAVFDFLGADVARNAGHSAMTTIVRGLSKDCATYLELLAEMVDLPELETEDFDKLRNEWLGRFRLLERNPDWAAEQALRQHLGAARDPSQGAVQGSSAIVEQTSLGDVRSFYRRYYRPERLVVTIVGDLPPEEMLAAGEKVFSGWKTGPLASERTLAASQRTTWPSELETRQGALVVAGIASLPVGHQDYHPLLILTQILSGGPGGGKLGDRVLASDAAIYDIRADVRGGAQQQLFSVRAAASASEVEKVLALMREEFARLKEGRFTPEEVKRVKRGLIHAWAVKMGNNDGLGEMLQDIEAQGLGIEYLEKYPSLIEAVSTDSLLDCARTRFDFDEAAVVVLKTAAGSGV